MSWIKVQANIKSVTISQGAIISFTGGYEMGISPRVKFLPSVLIKYHPDNPVQIDYNAQYQFKRQDLDGYWLPEQEYAGWNGSVSAELSAQNGIFL